MVAPTQERRIRRPEPPRRAPRKALPWPLNIYQTAVGKKWVMAITGLGLIGFVLAHMAGNLKLYLGAEDIYDYGVFLKEMGSPILPKTHLLWILRAGLLAMFVLHIHSAYTLTRMNAVSNPKANVTGQKTYDGGQEFAAANFASRSMRWTGIIIALYVIFHLFDLTWGATSDEWVKGDHYNNIVDSFQRVPVAAIYIVANVALAVHIFHGAWSMFQSLGVTSPQYNHLRRYVAYGISAVILIGNVSFPIAVLLGIVDHVEPTYLEDASALLSLI
ncbi:MAG: succinate dehydrogenase cytochrome b subunit [Actinomycetota bacterium]